MSFLYLFYSSDAQEAWIEPSSKTLSVSLADTRKGKIILYESQVRNYIFMCEDVIQNA